MPSRSLCAFARMTWSRASSRSGCSPARSSSSRPSISRSDATGVRSSCEAVATKVRRASSCSRRRRCMVAKARARSPTSSRVVVRLQVGRPRPRRRAAPCRAARLSRRTSRCASRSPKSMAITKPTTAAGSSARRTRARGRGGRRQRAPAGRARGAAFPARTGRATCASAASPSPAISCTVTRCRTARSRVGDALDRVAVADEHVPARADDDHLGARVAAQRVRDAVEPRASPGRRRAAAPRRTRCATSRRAVCERGRARPSRSRWSSGASSVTVATASVSALTASSAAMRLPGRPEARRAAHAHGPCRR